MPNARIDGMGTRRAHVTVPDAAWMEVLSVFQCSICAKQYARDSTMGMLSGGTCVAEVAEVTFSVQIELRRDYVLPPQDAVGGPGAMETQSFTQARHTCFAEGPPPTSGYFYMEK